MQPTVLSKVVKGEDLRIGAGFTAEHFAEDAFAGAIDPVVMVDHFRMTAPTFEPHPHAGISAVTYVFEDSTSPHVNYDSLGNHQPIVPGALHWFAAGRGAIHTEQPEGVNPFVHALQIFVNLPASKKQMAPYAVHLEPSQIPEFLAEGVRVRVVLGESNGVVQPATSDLPEPFTLLDAQLEPGAGFSHVVPPGWNSMVCLIRGRVSVETQDGACELTAGEGIAATALAAAPLGSSRLQFVAGPQTQLAILSGPALREPLVKQGPFVMNTQEQMQDAIRAFRSGQFGELRLPA